jgi:hypothetical protein
LHTVIKRFAYPDWCTLEIEPEEAESDYAVYREELMTTFVNLSLIKPIHLALLEIIYTRLG